MDGEDQLALVAAGTLEPSEVKEIPTGIDPNAAEIAAIIRSTVEQVFDSMREDEEQEERAARLADLLEDEEIYAERARMERFSALTAAAQPPEPAPTPVTAPQAPQGQAPVPAPEAGEVEGGTDGTWPPDDTTLLQMQMDARYSIIEEPTEGAEVANADRQEATPSVGPAEGQTPPQPQAQV